MGNGEMGNGRVSLQSDPHQRLSRVPLTAFSHPKMLRTFAVGLADPGEG